MFNPRHPKYANQRRGLWMPRDRGLVKTWLARLCQEEQRVKGRPLDPSLISFEKFVNGDATLKQLAHDMFAQVPDMPPYNKDPSGEKQVRDFGHMLRLINHVLGRGPEFLDPKDHTSEQMGLIGFPINAILDWPMGTKAGYVFWLVPTVNKAFYPVLKTWGDFLSSPASQVCLEPSKGWTSPDALTLLAQHGNDGGTTHSFEQLYVCKPAEPFYGFQSWDAFFTRSFNPGIRPIAAPDGHPSSQYPDPTQVIVNSCEAAPLQVVRKVNYMDTFWLKNQPYSLINMLDNDPLAYDFIGGTVFQGFLSALSYHQWHAPVSGQVVKIHHVPGTYYSENYYEGFANPSGPPDPAAANNSQPFLSAVATRGIIYIQAENKDIGLMAVVYIGMAEVSSCEFTVHPGQKITKGQPIGTFHFGGSTHCMLFRPETNLLLTDPGPWDPNTSTNAPVNGAFAVVTPPAKS